MPVDSAPAWKTARPGARASATVMVVLKWAFTGVTLWILWQFVLAPNVSKVFLPTPHAVWTRFTKIVGDGTAWHVVKDTVTEALAGFVVGFVAGIVVALAIGLSPAIVGKLVEPVVTAMYATPKFILVPILFLWLGTGFLPRILLIAIAVFPVIVIYTITGIRTVDPDLVTMMTLAGASRVQIGRKVLLPHTMGYVRTAVTFASPHTLEVAIGAEILFGSLTGIGGMLNTTSNLFDAAGVFTALGIGTIICSIAIALAGAANPGGNRRKGSVL